MPIQDNLNGALLISAIDFILSFIIIGGIGVILALFPLLNRFRKQTEPGPVTIPRQQSPLKESVSSADSPLTGSIHPGLSDQQLVVLLTAAASEVLGRPIRVDRFRPVTIKGLNWAAQGRHELQSHRLK